METVSKGKSNVFNFTLAVAFLFLQGMGAAEEKSMMEEESMMKQKQMMAQENKRMGIPPGVNPIHKTYIPVTGDFEAARVKDIKEKDFYMERQRKLLERRYDLADRPSKVMMSAGRKPVQEGCSRQTAGRHDVGETGRHAARNDQGEGFVSKGLSSLAPFQARNGGTGLS